jgi:hypothetical protein
MMIAAETEEEMEEEEEVEEKTLPREMMDGRRRANDVGAREDEDDVVVANVRVGNAR